MLLAVSNLAGRLLAIALACACAYVGLRVLLRISRWWFWRGITRLLPPRSSSSFKVSLRDLVFRDPAGTMARLCGDDQRKFVEELWAHEASWWRSQPATAGDVPGAEIDVVKLLLADGRAIAVVKMPPKLSRLHLIGVVLPEDPSLSGDPERARAAVRYFTLAPWSLDRDTDLCEERAEGDLRTYNIGAPRDPEGFARAVGAKLADMGR